MERAVMVNAAPVRNEAGEIIGGVVIFNDVTALKALEAERAQTLSFFAHDMKSPLFGAASFLERLPAGKAGHLEPKQGEYTAHGLELYFLSFRPEGEILRSLTFVRDDKSSDFSRAQYIFE